MCRSSRRGPLRPGAVWLNAGMTTGIQPRREALTPSEVEAINTWWRAANYLSVGQIYLLDNPLLREPLRPEHTKPRLLGPWGTTPGLHFVYVHMNRAVGARDLTATDVTGPGVGVPVPGANAYLDGTYTEV